VIGDDDEPRGESVARAALQVGGANILDEAGKAAQTRTPRRSL
jgi:hypothetical protein